MAGKIGQRLCVVFLMLAMVLCFVACDGADATNGGIASIDLTSRDGLKDTYTITYANGDTSIFIVTNGKDGIQGIQGMPGTDGHSPVITIVDGYWYIDGVNTQQQAQGVKGEDGNGISDITLSSQNGLVDTYTITYTNGDTTTFNVTNGAQGVQGIQGIQGVPGKDGNTPVITIVGGYWYIDGVNTWQQAQGVKGEDGVGISGITLSAQDGLVDTYTITYTNGSTSTFTVTNGAQGIQGIQGVPGVDGHTPVITIIEGYWHIDGENTYLPAQGVKGEDGNGISSLFHSDTDGLIDTYTIIFTNGSTTTFTVTNGAQGIQGIQGVPGNDGHTPVITIVDGYWYIDGVNTWQESRGVKGDTGNGISDITLTGSEDNKDFYTITLTNGDVKTFTVTNGKDGDTPYIGENGNWWIGSDDTNVKAGNSSYEIMYNKAAVSIDWYDESETVYYIDDVYDFNGIAYLVNESEISFQDKTLVLQNNIDFNGVYFNPIGTPRHSFYGVFEGNGHAINNLTIDENNVTVLTNYDMMSDGEYYREFCTTLFYSNRGTIKNLTVVDYKIELMVYEEITYAHQYAIAVLVRNNYGTVTNIDAYGRINLSVGADISTRIAEIVVDNFGIISDCTAVSDTVINAKNGAKYGPIAFYNYYMISGCTTYGYVTLNQPTCKQSAIGGITSTASYFEYHPIISNCLSKKVITVNNAGPGGFGGIVGDSFNASITDCKFEGIINCTSDMLDGSGPSIGGIVGWMDLMSDEYKSVITGCTSSGTINAKIGSSYSSLYGIVRTMEIGGIIGSISCHAIISDNLFDGVIFSSVDTKYLLALVGGIIGKNEFGIRLVDDGDFTTEVSNCSNQGEIYTHGYIYRVGGIVADTSLTTYVDLNLVDLEKNKVTYSNLKFEGFIKIDRDNKIAELPIVGGIAGGAFSITIKDCDVNGYITLDSFKDVVYGEIAGIGRQSNFLDGGETRTEIIRCNYGNTLTVGQNEYHFRYLVGITEYTYLEMDISEADLTKMENYQLISDNEKALYIEIYTWAIELAEYCDVVRDYQYYRWFTHYALIDLLEYDITATRALEIFNMVVFDNPEFIHLSLTDTAVSEDEDERLLGLAISSDYTDSTSTDSLKDDLDRLESKLSLVENAIVGMSDYEKICFIFRFILDNCEYALDGDGNPIADEDTVSLAGAMLNQLAICEGYALAFNYLCDQMGISSYIIVSTELNHAWNMVELDGEWYYVDATWSDTSDIYFLLLGSQSFNETHGVFDEMIEYPAANEDDYAAA